MRLINDAGRAIIKESEGLSLTAYHDFAKGTLTIGWGHTGPDVTEGLTITLDKAEQLLTSDLAYTCAQVAALMPGATDNQFSACVSLAYNEGITELRTSSVLRAWRVGDRIGAARAFLLWDKAHVDGQLVEVEGLFERRIDEVSLYLDM
jgi:lysozyme